MSQVDTFTDGLWHEVDMDVQSGGDGSTGRVSVTVDGESDVSERQLSFQTSNIFLIGGDNKFAIKEAVHTCVYFEFFMFIVSFFRRRWRYARLHRLHARHRSEQRRSRRD